MDDDLQKTMEGCVSQEAVGELIAGFQQLGEAAARATGAVNTFRQAIDDLERDWLQRRTMDQRVHYYELRRDGLYMLDAMHVVDTWPPFTPRPSAPPT